MELLEPVARRNTEVREGVGGVEDEKLAQGDAPNGVTEPSYSLPPPDLLGIPVGEGLDHLTEYNGGRYERLKPVAGYAALQPPIRLPGFVCGVIGPDVDPCWKGMPAPALMGACGGCARPRAGSVALEVTGPR